MAVIDRKIKEAGFKSMKTNRFLANGAVLNVCV